MFTPIIHVLSLPCCCKILAAFLPMRSYCVFTSSSLSEDSNSLSSCLLAAARIPWSAEPLRDRRAAHSPSPESITPHSLSLTPHREKIQIQLHFLIHRLAQPLHLLRALPALPAATVPVPRIRTPPTTSSHGSSMDRRRHSSQAHLSGVYSSVYIHFPCSRWNCQQAQ